MKIDKRSVSWTQVQQVNKVIDTIWFEAKTVDKEGLVIGSFGPDCVELMIGGRTLYVYDRYPEIDAIIYKDDCVHIANRELFEICSKFSPIERLTWHLEGGL